MTTTETATLTTREPPAAYVCPGEDYAIGRAVHLARLAAFDPRCRSCPLRHDTGPLPKAIVERLEDTQRRVERLTLADADGLRGVYVNEITRARAGRIAARFAETLWADRPLIATHTDGAAKVPRSAPTVVVGRDERFSSSDIAIGVTASLRRMGCRVVDVHVTTRPRFWFAVDHLDATAGVFVTGCGKPPAWTGLDFVDGNGRPVSNAAVLAELGHDDRRPTSRPTRRGGGYRTFQAGVPYEAGLWKHFHALRPLQLVLGVASRLVRATLETLFAKLPCTLDFVDLPQRARNAVDPTDADVARLAEAVTQRNADLGVLIDDDGQSTGFLDETGALLPCSTVAQLVAETLLVDHPEAAFVVESGLAWDTTARTVTASSGDAATIAETMTASEAVAAFTAGGRFWFREALPTSDAILTLARLLATLSRSDAPVSERHAGSRTEGEVMRR